jgi:uncharacterized linocin/CFP29 family protein
LSWVLTATKTAPILAGSILILVMRGAYLETSALGVLMASGKQFASIILGEDMQVGFIGPVGENLEFTISETLALLVKEPGAICVLKEK